jgi:hypothetical protein
MQIIVQNGSTTIPLHIESEAYKISQFVHQQIMNEISTLYTEEDIDMFILHVKGVNKTTELLIRVLLNFTETIDIVEFFRNKLSHLNIPEDQPGLSFMSMNVTEILAPGTVLNFWYVFNKQEFQRWNYMSNTIDSLNR